MVLAIIEHCPLYQPVIRVMSRTHSTLTGGSLPSKLGLENATGHFHQQPVWFFFGCLDHKGFAGYLVERTNVSARQEEEEVVVVLYKLLILAKCIWWLFRLVCSSHEAPTQMILSTTGCRPYEAQRSTEWT